MTQPTAGLTPSRHRSAKARPARCQICRAPTIPGLDLGHQPVADRMLTVGELARPETQYPLRLVHCPDCGLTQLGYIVPPRVVYRDFPFLSGTTDAGVRYLQALPPGLVDRFALDHRSFAVDIGSNDGTLLQAYRPFGIPCLGVDPAFGPVRAARGQGIETLHAFFDERTARVILDSHGPAHVITACGVFGHVADLDGLMRGVQLLLAPGGAFVSDSQYWLDMAEHLHYDNIFHEHLRYYSMRPLAGLFARYGMEMFDVERLAVYGGSIRVYAGHQGAHPVGPAVWGLEELETSVGLYSVDTARRFERAVAERRRRLFDQVHRLVRAGRKVVGIGAPAKAATVCNACGLGPDLLSYITEVNPLRIGKYLPGVHVPVVDEENLFADPHPPDAAVLFSWNYRDQIVPKLRARGFAGELLEP